MASFDVGTVETGPVRIEVAGVTLYGDFEIPRGASGLVLFAHGTGSGRHSPRNRQVAEVLRGARFGTLLFDLLTAREEIAERETGHLRFDIGLLAARLIGVTQWAREMTRGAGFPIGYFGASTGAAAALVAAAELPGVARAVVSRGGRPDLAGAALERVRAPTLLIVGSLDTWVLELNRQALYQIQAEKELAVVPGATHLFSEPGTLEEVARLATGWFERQLAHRRQQQPQH
jgi:putative phosphoribosyl transferase